MISIGDKLPNVDITVINADGQSSVSAAEYFSGKKAVLIAVPGAFTPTCSEAHLPGFIVKYDDLVAKGVEEVACLSVNDSFVMTSWKAAQNAENITMVADGGGSFTQALGVDLNTGDFGGVRSKRYSMLLEDGVVTQLNLEEATGFEVSDVDTLLGQL
jgi:peroxiredoxin